MNMKKALTGAETDCQACLDTIRRCGDVERADCYLYMAIIAIKRAIPEKPTIRQEKPYCPSCNRRLKNDKKNWFCPNCGKAIDWEV